MHLALMLGLTTALLPTAAAPVAPVALDDVVRVSVAGDGTEADNASTDPAISADGSVVAYASLATNIAKPVNPGTVHIFTHDRRTGGPELISTGLRGTAANGSSAQPRISANGRFVLFLSAASNLVAGDTDDQQDAFVHDRNTGRTTIVPGGATAAAISDNGRFVVAETAATEIYLYDRSTKQATLLSHRPDGTAAGGSAPAISGNGRFVAFSSPTAGITTQGEPNASGEVVLYDRVTGAITRTPADQPDVWLDDTGRLMTFWSVRPDLVADDDNHNPDTFLFDRVTGAVTLMSARPDGHVGEDLSQPAGMSGDGRYVLLRSWASDLGEQPVDKAYLLWSHDRRTGVNTVITTHPSAADVSTGGRFVAYDTITPGPGDTNEASDVFVRQLY